MGTRRPALALCPGSQVALDKGPFPQAQSPACEMEHETGRALRPEEFSDSLTLSGAGQASGG